ncbi:CRTAC1 family protein [Ascidiaceihabitans sp.]|uniref:CRTAC1 family protein n=1 Tax=Ascidiaceihabitans sp. TaxID=1872644 RepID=UPI003297AE63
MQGKVALFTAGIAWAGFAPFALADIRFAPVTVPEHFYTGGWEHFVGGGLSVLDCDGDAKPDLFAAGGAAPSALWRNTSSKDGIAFAPVTGFAQLSGVTGAYPMDLNNDTHLDLVVMRVGQDTTLLGDGQCGFTPAPLPGAAFEDRWTTAFSAIWSGDDTLPSLAFGHYVDRSDPDGPFEACDTNLLLRPDSTNNAYIATELAPGFCALSMLISDWSRNGTPDLRVSNDRHYYVKGGAEQLWTLGDTPRLYTQDDGWITHQLWGMGIASRDLDRDGLTEVFLSSMGDQRLQEWTGQGAEFKDAPFERGAAAHRPYTGGDGRPSTGWHIALGDVQNDGMDDVFIAKGNVQQMPGMAMEDPNNLLIQDEKGQFSEAGLTAGIASLHRARGASLTDLDGDGLLDLIVVNRMATLEVYRNTSAQTGYWLSVEARQPNVNTRAIGGWIEVMDDMGLQMRELVIGGGHAGGSAGPEHFGLGDAEGIMMRVIWPDTTATQWMAVQTNQRVRVMRDGETATLTRY